MMERRLKSVGAATDLNHRTWSQEKVTRLLCWLWRLNKGKERKAEADVSFTRCQKEVNKKLRQMLTMSMSKEKS